MLQLLLFGGHGTGGWLSRYDIYYNDCVVLDRGEFYIHYFHFRCYCNIIKVIFPVSCIDLIVIVFLDFIMSLVSPISSIMGIDL